MLCVCVCVVCVVCVCVCVCAVCVRVVDHIIHTLVRTHTYRILVKFCGDKVSRIS